MPVSLPPPANFSFLARHDAGLVVVATRAEQYFADGSVTSLMNLRQFGQMLEKQVAARTGVFTTMEESQAELLARLRREGVVPRDVLDVFHDLRRRDNDAIQGDHAEAIATLRLARQLAIFFHRTFGERAAALLACPLAAGPAPARRGRPPLGVAA